MDYIKNVASVLEMVEPVDGVIKISTDVRDLLVKLLRGQERWISVKDDLPKEHDSIFANHTHLSKHMWAKESDNVIVYVRFPDGTGVVTTGCLRNSDWVTTVSKTLPQTVTHWMPLPEPPEGVKQDD